MKSYEINEDTLLIMPKDENSSIVFEDRYNYDVDEKVNQIMEDSCEYFGSTLDGRKKGTQVLTGITHKVPIVVEESSNMIFFPTASPRDNECMWISLNNIDSYERDEKCCKINFKNGKSIKINVSYGIIHNQVLRSSRLQMLFNDRKIEKNNTKKTKKTKK